MKGSGFARLSYFSGFKSSFLVRVELVERFSIHFDFLRFQSDLFNLGEHASKNGCFCGGK